MDRAAALEWRQGLAEELRGQFPGSFVREAGEGGIFAALWNMAEACNAGFTVDMKKLPILQETIEVCEALELNPYEIASGGCAVLGQITETTLSGDWGLRPSLWKSHKGQGPDPLKRRTPAVSEPPGGK